MRSQCTSLSSKREQLQSIFFFHCGWLVAFKKKRKNATEYWPTAAITTGLSLVFQVCSNNNHRDGYSVTCFEKIQPNNIREVSQKEFGTISERSS